MKNLYKTILVSFLLVFLICSCTTSNTDQLTDLGAEDKADQAVVEEKTLNIVVHQWMISKYQIEAAAANFEKNHPGVKVIVSTMDNKNQNILLESFKAGNNTYDLAFGWDAPGLKAYMKADVLENWDKFMASYPKESLITGFMKLGQYNGVQYVIPMTGEIMSNVVRYDILSKAGYVDATGKLIPPKTMSEFVDYAKKLTVPDSNGDGLPEVYGGCIMATGNFPLQNYMYILQATQGTIYGADGKTIDFSSANAKDILTQWQKGIKDGYLVPNSGLCKDYLKQGKLAMLVGTHSRWIEGQNELIVEGGKLDIMPIVAGDKGSLAFVHGIWRPKGRANQALAEQFIKEEILNDAYFLWTINKFGKMSPLKSTYTNAAINSTQKASWQVLVADADKAAIAPAYNGYSDLDKLVLNTFTGILNSSMTVDAGLAAINTGMAGFDLNT